MLVADEKILNIVVPMAGRGSRFAQAGFDKPKPLILLGGIPMIQWVINNIRPARAHRFIFVCLKEHIEANSEVPEALNRLCPGCIIVKVDQVTEGAACTVLLAREYIDNECPLMIANSDQYVELPIDRYLAALDIPDVSGLIMTFWADHPKWSYCRMNKDGTVAEVVEKKVISNEATVGLYNFRYGKDFVSSADEMIKRNLRVNNEFYVAPAYNLLIEKGGKIVVRQTGREYAGMYGLGTPDDYEFFQTTSQFQSDCPREYVSPYFSEQVRHAKLAHFYALFFNTKNRSGLEALLHEDVRFTGVGKNLLGRRAVLARINDLQAAGSYRCEPLLPDTKDDEDAKVLEYETLSGKRHSCRNLVFSWVGDMISEIRSDLVETL